MAKTAKVIDFKKEEAKKKNLIENVLKGARKETPEKKNGTTLLTVSDKLKKLAKEVYDLKTDEENIKAKRTTKEAELIDNVTPLRKQHVITKGYEPSVKVPTSDGLTLTVVYPHRFAKCAPENEEALIKAITEDKYKKYFNVVNVITVKQDISQEKLEKLIKKVGAEEFAEFFDVDTTIKPNDRYKNDQFTEFTDKEILDLELAGVKAIKASVKK